MQPFTQALAETWRLLQEMAPSLWLGFLVAGLLAVLLPKAWIKRHLAKGGWASIAKGALLGAPMPLCSCGVVPVAAELRRLGASRGAVAAFLVSTPQTGVENMLVCLALLGPAFAVASPLVALGSGLLVGLLVRAMTRQDPDPDPAPSTAGATPPAWRRFLDTSFRVLPGDLAGPLAAGLLVAGAISAWVPADFFAGRGGAGLGVKLLVLAISVPMYVCSAASIPVAATMIAAGLSPGAALVFLMAGPATNTATLAALFVLLGRRGAFAYIAGLTLSVLLFAELLDYLVAHSGTVVLDASCHADLAWWHPVLAVGLLALLANAKRLNRPAAGDR